MTVYGLVFRVAVRMVVFVFVNVFVHALHVLSPQPPVAFTAHSVCFPRHSVAFPRNFVAIKFEYPIKNVYFCTIKQYANH